MSDPSAPQFHEQPSTPEDQTDVESPSIPEQPKRPPPPPLRIHHVFLLTAVVSLMAGILRVFPAWSEFNQTQETVWRTYQALVSIFISTGLTLTALGVWWRRKGFAYWDQPGQYIALFYGIWVISYLVGLWEVFIFGDTSYHYSMVIWSCLVLVTVPVDIYVAWKVADTKVWRIYFVLGALASVVQCLGATDLWWVMAMFLLILGWAILTDIRRSVSRHWSHWCGCALTTCNGILRLGLTVLIQLGFFETSA